MERRNRPERLRLWRNITTSAITQQIRGRAHSRGRAEILFRDGLRMEDEIAVANAHPLGRRRFRREDYVHKFCELSEEILSVEERDRFLSAVHKTCALRREDLRELNIAALPGSLEQGRPGIF